jgi:hypothetical protein
MPDPRSVMKEFRLLDQKRLVEGLSRDEEARHAELADLVGPDPAPRGGGFDVSAAAARLRESLLPAGLRSRPDAELPGEPLTASPADALAFASETAELYAPAGDAVLDSGAQAWDPNAYAEPATEGYDPNAYAAIDPNAPGYDPGAQPYDPNAYAEPGAEGYDPGAYAAVDPNAEPLDPNAPPYDPNAYAEPGAEGFDPNAYAAVDPNAYAPLDPNAPPYDPNAYAEPGAEGFDPNAYAAVDPSAYAAPDPNAPPYDPNAYAEPGAEGFDPNAYAAIDPNAEPLDPNAPPYDPNAYAEPGAEGFDPNAYAAVDPNAYAAIDPNAEPLDPNAQPYDPNAYAALDPNAPPYDPNAYAEPGAEGFDPNAYAAVDPNAYAAIDPDAEPLDPNAPPYDPNAYAEPGTEGFDPNAYAAIDPGAEPLDPNAAPSEAGAVSEPMAEGFDQAYGAYDADPAAYDAAAAAAAGYDPGAFAEVVELSASEVDADAAGALEDPSALDGAGLAVDTTLEAEPSLEPPLPAPALDLDLPPDGLDLSPPPIVPVDAPLGEYDETAAGPTAAGVAALEALLPFDPASDAVIPPGAIPDGFAALPGEYDDTHGFDLAAGADADLGALPPEDAAPVEAEPVAPVTAVEPPAAAGWHSEAELEHGFALESGGSFDATADAAAPEWAVGAAAPPWETGDLAEEAADAPLDAGAAPGEVALGGFEGDLAEPEPESSFDLGGPPPELDRSAPELSSEDPDLAFALPGAAASCGEAPLDLDLDLDALTARAPVVAQEPPAALELPPLELGAMDAAKAPDELPEVMEIEELPTIDGEEILEEIPADEHALAPPASLDFDPLPAPASLDFDDPLPAPRAVESAPPVLAPVAPVAWAPLPDCEAPEAAVVPEEVLAEFDAELAPEPEPEPALPQSHVSGAHRVVVHTVEGQVKRGVLEDVDLAAPALALAQSPGVAETIPAEKVKAIFFMLAPGDDAPAAAGRKVRVTFRDGRQVAGFSPDYAEGAVGFFMIPADTRTNTARIWVYGAAVRAVAVS